MKKFFTALIILFVLLHCSCSQNGNLPTSPDLQQASIHIEPTKWYGNKKAAMSITFDASWGLVDDSFCAQLQKTIDAVLSRGLRMDMECVTSFYCDPGCDVWLSQMANTLYPSGIHFFGHGHYHYDFDTLSYNRSKELMSQCFSLMQQWNLKPRAYAYPYARCRQHSTEKACRDAGFICGRSMEWMEPKLFICADSVAEPDDWYRLPSIPMANDFDNYFQNHEEVLPIMQYAEAHGAWIIFTYHNIGLPENWGYYNWNEFIKDINYLQTRDFWPGNMDDIAAYIKECNAFFYTINDSTLGQFEKTYVMTFADNLDNHVYFQPLTISFDVMSMVACDSVIVNQASVMQTYEPQSANHFLIDIIPNEQSCILTLKFAQ